MRLVSDHRSQLIVFGDANRLVYADLCRPGGGHVEHELWGRFDGCVYLEDASVAWRFSVWMAGFSIISIS